MIMGFANDIMALLKAAGIGFSAKEYDGITLLDTERQGFLAASINAHSVSKALETQKIIKEIISTASARPIVIAEDRWHSDQTGTRNRILAHSGLFRKVFARDCVVRRIDKKTAAPFLNDNHAYGDALCRYRYGLYLSRGEGTVLPVGVGEFSAPRRIKDEDRIVRSFEWVRYASASDTRVLGGMGKILKHFIKETSPDDVMSYADLEWSDGRAYKELGFCIDGERRPVIFRIDPLTWHRTPVKEGEGGHDNCLYYINQGSLKYRLRTEKHIL